MQALLDKHAHLFVQDDSGEPRFSDAAFKSLLRFVESGDFSFQSAAVQAGVRWSQAGQRVSLRNAISTRGCVTPLCMWALRCLRGSADDLFRNYSSPEMHLMQVLLLKEADPAKAVPFLIERFLTRRDAPDEIRSASRLCILRLLDAGGAPDLVRALQHRYPKVEILHQWRPTIPGTLPKPPRPTDTRPIDFHQLVRSVHDLKELSSLTRTIYLTTLFHIPLKDKEWDSLMLSRTDQLFLQRLRQARVIESFNGGSLLSSDTAVQATVRRFLYDSYAPAKESINRNLAIRSREERERKVRNSELDRHALSMVPDGIICVDRTGFLYFLNPAAESMLNENHELKVRLFGSGSMEDALRHYSPQSVLTRITASVHNGGEGVEVYGDRVAMGCGGKRFEVRLGPQVIVLRDTTDQSLVDQEIGKLYRHELKAALDVMGAGLSTVRDLAARGALEESIDFLDQVEEKRKELFSMLEERIDFIRLHSDAFHIHQSPVNLNLVADKCTGNYRDAAAAKGVGLKSDHLHVPAVLVSGEERFLVRAVDNIIRNAVKFSEKGSEIEVSVGSSGSFGFVRVQDQGPGIPPEIMGKIFTLGFTTGGSGRGLYLARRIAAAHKGRIDVKSKPCEGACFTILIPMITEG